jgi:hypothetical protein
MCRTVLIPCQRTHTTTGDGFWTALAVAGVGVVARAVWLLVTRALVPAAAWTAVAVARAAGAAWRAGRRRLAARRTRRLVAVVVDRPALTSTPHTDTRWSTLAGGKERTR